jgi:protein-L-isoaspartate(D-aspartate) O-methyltransferase
MLGTGSGYQAAVLAEMGAVVQSIEILPRLAAGARAALREAGYLEVTVHVGDGYRCVPAAAPFAGVLVTAAAAEVPEPLLEQLAPGGRLVMPVGEIRGVQSLVLITKGQDGTISERKLLPVRFVPLVRGG